MALPIRPTNPNNPIPNNPFYYPETNYIKGEYSPFILGSGLNIDVDTGVISATGGGGGTAVSKIIAGAGISVTPSGGTGNVTVTNAGVKSLTAGSGINISGVGGNLTIASTSGATVSNVTGVAPVSVVNGTTTPVVSIANASVSGRGSVQLYDNTDSSSTTLALTAAQGKNLQDQINALVVAGTVELAGTIDASTGLVVSVTSVGTTDGYTVGAVLPAASATTVNSYVIVTVPGTMTPPGGTPTVATRGDWFLVSQTSPGVYAWEFLNVGFDAPPATTTVPGIVELATNTETQTGTDSTTAVTPAGAAATYVPLSTLTAKGTLIAGQAANTPVALPIGSINQVLQVDPTCTAGMKWATLPAGCTGTVTQVSTGAGLTGGPITTVGAIDLKVQSGVTAGSYTNSSVTVDCYGVITAISSGVAYIPYSCITGKGSLITGTAASTPVALSVGTDGQVLTACSGSADGLCWNTPTPAIPCACVTGKGVIITGTAPNAPTALPVGTDGQLLTACAASPEGLCWVNAPAPAIPLACLTAKGALVAGSAANTAITVPVGQDGEVLTACAASPRGMR